MRLLNGILTMAVKHFFGLAGLLCAAQAGAIEAEVPQPVVIQYGAASETASTVSENLDITPATPLPETAETDTATPGAQAPVASEAAAATPQPQDQALAGMTTFGPIKTGESLSTVAIQISEATGIHVAQVMWALYDASPSAFKGSINRLRVGATLNVRPPAEMTAVSIKQARINIRDAAAETAVATTNSGEQGSVKPAPAITAAPKPTPPKPVATRLSTPPPTQAAATEKPASEPRRSADQPAPSLKLELPEVKLDEDVAPQGKLLPTDAPATDQALTGIPEARRPALPVTDELAEPETPATDTPDAGLLSGRQLILPIIALAGFIFALLIGSKRRRREREEARQAELAEASRKRSELLDLARGEPIAEPTPELHAAEMPTQVMPIAATELLPDDPREDHDPSEHNAEVSTPATQARTLVSDAVENTPELEDVAQATEPTMVMPAFDEAGTPVDNASGEQTDGGDDSAFESFDDGITAGDDIDSALDLARGYADMGEIDRARSLLNMVLSRGNAEQQAEARKVLDSLS